MKNKVKPMYTTDPEGRSKPGWISTRLLMTNSKLTMREKPGEEAEQEGNISKLIEVDALRSTVALSVYCGRYYGFQSLFSYGNTFKANRQAKIHNPLKTCSSVSSPDL